MNLECLQLIGDLRFRWDLKPFLFKELAPEAKKRGKASQTRTSVEYRMP
jgi:hypothetical protein